MGVELGNASLGLNLGPVFDLRREGAGLDLELWQD